MCEATGIKLKADCDLAKATDRVTSATKSYATQICAWEGLGDLDEHLASVETELAEARAHLLEVIRKIAFAGMEQVDTFESFTLSDERASEIIKEVMGCEQ